MTQPISAEIHHLISSVLMSAILIFSAIDFFRYRSITFPIIRENFNLLCAIFFFICTPAINIYFNHYDPVVLGQVIGYAFLTLTNCSFLFLAGYIWVRRSPVINHGRRHDLIWKKIFQKGVDDHSVFYNPKPLLLGVLFGLMLAFFSIIYVNLMSLIYPQAFLKFQSGIDFNRISGWVFMALMAPFFEEIFYRWYLFHGLKFLFRHFKSGNWIAIVLCSAIFAVGHFGYAEPIWIKELQTFIIGFVLCLYFPVLGIEGCIIAHLTINLIGVIGLFP